MNKSNQYKNEMTGKLGLYHVCCKLSEIGWTIKPTSGDARANRINCTNENSSKTISLQVRSRRGKDYATSISNPNEIIGDFWIIVLNTSLNNSECYVIPASEIANNIETQENESGKISHFLARKFNIEPFKENWKPIGSGFTS